MIVNWNWTHQWSLPEQWMLVCCIYTVVVWKLSWRHRLFYPPPWLFVMGCIYHTNTTGVDVRQKWAQQSFVKEPPITYATLHEQAHNRIISLIKHTDPSLSTYKCTQERDCPTDVPVSGMPFSQDFNSSSSSMHLEKSAYQGQGGIER